MIDFSTLQGLTIPEGVVKKIADASGRVLWNSDDGMRNITIIKGNTMFGYASVIVDGTEYKPNLMGGTTNLVVPAGTSIECAVRTYTASSSAETGAIAKIIVNGNVVAQTNDKTTYIYTVTKDATINLEVLSVNGKVGGSYGLLTITET